MLSGLSWDSFLLIILINIESHHKRAVVFVMIFLLVKKFLSIVPYDKDSFEDGVISLRFCEDGFTTGLHTRI
jgi:hypothetical protein